MENRDGPPLIRPTPRRPFELNLANPTPPEDDSDPSSPYASGRAASPGIAAGLLDPNHDSETLSRTASFKNLTSSTLGGIYSPAFSSRARDLDDLYDRDTPATPWGTGAQTPPDRSNLDEATYRVLKERSKGTSVYSIRRRHSQASPFGTSHNASTLAVRAALLFTLGVGYGVLVTRLHSDQDIGLTASFGAESLVLVGGYDWRYLVFWGAAGVVLGALLPWFDGVWEEAFGKYEGAPPRSELLSGKRASPDTDWALVMRGVGAFVGIVFAIRKLPWTSTMQVSMALALANPFLWYLIDRSKPGFWLSSAVGLVGSAILMGLNPDMMPAPTGFTPGRALLPNSTRAPQPGPPVLGAFVDQETIETCIWMVSVLFCSCVCFGNIGRRLALNESSALRGRWGGVR